MSMSRKKILFLAQFALLLAIELIFCFTPLGSIPIVPGLVVATLAMVPVVITAILLGTGAGAAMGFVAGLCSFLVWSFITPAPTSFVFTPIHSLPGVPHSGWSLVICFVPRILTGVVAGLCASAFGRSKHKALRSAPVAYGVSAALGSLDQHLPGAGRRLSLFREGIRHRGGAALWPPSGNSGPVGAYQRDSGGHRRLPRLGGRLHTGKKGAEKGRSPLTRFPTPRNRPRRFLFRGIPFNLTSWFRYISKSFVDLTEIGTRKGTTGFLENLVVPLAKAICIPSASEAGLYCINLPYT